MGQGTTLIGGQWISHAYLLELNTATITDLGTLGGSTSTANALNQLTPPQVVGWASTGSVNAGFLYNGALPLIDLSPFQSMLSINNAGGMIGLMTSGDAGYLASNGTFTDVSLLSDGTLFGMRGNALNSASTANVVGQALTYVVVSKSSRILRPRAWRWQVGSTVITDLNTITPNRGTIFLRFANGVNDSGYIVGSDCTEKNNGSTGNQTAYLLTPNP